MAIVQHLFFPWCFKVEELEGFQSLVERLDWTGLLG